MPTAPRTKKAPRHWPRSAIHPPNQLPATVPAICAVVSMAMARERSSGGCALAVSAMAVGMNNDSEMPITARRPSSMKALPAKPVATVTMLHTMRLRTTSSRFEKRSAN